MLNLRRQAQDDPVVPQKFSEGSDLPSVNMAPHYASRYAVTAAEPTFASTIIGNLGAPMSQWGDSEESDEYEERDGREPYRRMEGMELQLRGQRKIAVEVTEEVMVDVEDAIRYPPKKHRLHHST